MAQDGIHRKNIPAVKKFSIAVTISKATSAGTVKAYADVRIGTSLTLRGVKIVQQPGQQPWVAMPSREWTGPDGKRKYEPVIELSGALKVQVNDAVLGAWQQGAEVAHD